MNVEVAFIRMAEVRTSIQRKRESVETAADFEANYTDFDLPYTRGANSADL